MPPLAPCHCTHRYADEPPTHILCPLPALLPLRYCHAQHSMGLGKRTPGPFNSTTPLLLPRTPLPACRRAPAVRLHCARLRPQFCHWHCAPPPRVPFSKQAIAFSSHQPNPFYGPQPRPPFHQAPWPIPADLLHVASTHLHARWPLPVLFRPHLLCSCCGMMQHTEHITAARACHVNSHAQGIQGKALPVHCRFTSRPAAASRHRHRPCWGPGSARRRRRRRRSPAAASRPVQREGDGEEHKSNRPFGGGIGSSILL